MLYSNLNDSAPLLEVPDYLGRADANGNFLINNVRPATYRLFALQDLNRNYKYDVPEEYIGFLDSAIHLSPSLFTDLLKDTADIQNEGYGDTLLSAFGSDSIPEYVQDSLRFFVQDSLRIMMQDSLMAFQDTSAFGIPDSVIVEGEDSLTLADLAPWSVFVDVFLFQEDRTAPPPHLPPLGERR